MFKIQTRIVFDDGKKSQWTSTAYNKTYKNIRRVLQALYQMKENEKKVRVIALQKYDSWNNWEYRPIHFYK